MSLQWALLETVRLESIISELELLLLLIEKNEKDSSVVHVKNRLEQRKQDLEKSKSNLKFKL